ncbi:hypothetical protein C8Q75DRAFT_752408 [Abortiporus biennis]|nr:hypothetical protein C8Q75DRAFT_752408 [Abortiporus biennis]
MSYPTSAEVRQVAQRAISIFTRNGLSACLFGSAGCSLYGCSRSPNDVDIIVMSNIYTTEQLKQMLVRGNKLFYTRPAKTPGATFKVLFHKLPVREYHDVPRRYCKVDLLIPGVLNIPFISSERIVRLGSLPVLPIIPLLLLKLQGWSDHRASTRADLVAKQYTDIRDVAELLRIVVERGEHLDQAVEWLPAEFIDAAKERLTRYFEIVRPSQSVTQNWSTIGF